MKPLGPDARSLLDAASGGDEPSADDAARVRAKLAARLAVATAAGAGATVATKSVAAATGAGTATATAGATTTALGVGTTAGVGATVGAGSVSVGAKVLLAIALVGGSAATGAVVLGEESPSRAEPPAAFAPERAGEKASPPIASAKSDEASPTPAEDSAGASALVPEDAPAARSATAPPTRAVPSAIVVNQPRSRTSAGEARRPAVTRAATDAEPAAAPSAGEAPPAAAPAGATNHSSPTASDTVAEEAALLRSANAALTRGDGAAALARLDEHALRFPRGALVEERQAARVLALCASGRTSEARALAASFVAAAPRSPLVPRVSRACAEGPSTGR